MRAAARLTTLNRYSMKIREIVLRIRYKILQVISTEHGEGVVAGAAGDWVGGDTGAAAL